MGVACTQCLGKTRFPVVRGLHFILETEFTLNLRALIMYIPDHFKEENPERLAALIEGYPLGTLITVHDGFPFVSHLPFLFERHSGTHDQARKGRVFWADRWLTNSVLLGSWGIRHRRWTLRFPRLWFLISTVSSLSRNTY